MYALIVGLGVNSTKSIMIIYKPVTKEIKKQLGDMIYPNETTSYRMDYGLQTMQAIALMSRVMQDLENRGLLSYATILQEIDADCDKFYKDVQRHLTQNKNKSD